MAKYIDNNGAEVDAICATGEEGIVNVKNGDWLVRDVMGALFVVEPDYFANNYRQKYPRAVDRENVAVVSPSAA